MGKVIRAALAAALLVAASCAQAKLLTWYLQDVRFEDGGIASGFFAFDPETIGFDNETNNWTATPPPMFDISSTTDAYHTRRWSQEDSLAGVQGGPHIFYIFFMRSNFILGLGFDAPLPIAGGTVGLNLGSSSVLLFAGIRRVCTR